MKTQSCTWASCSQEGYTSFLLWDNTWIPSKWLTGEDHGGGIYTGSVSAGGVTALWLVRSLCHCNLVRHLLHITGQYDTKRIKAVFPWLRIQQWLEMEELLAVVFFSSFIFCRTRHTVVEICQWCSFFFFPEWSIEERRQSEIREFGYFMGWKWHIFWLFHLSIKVFSASLFQSLFDRLTKKKVSLLTISFALMLSFCSSPFLL